MYTEIIINVESEETRIAILEDHKIMELLMERPGDKRLQGNIYKGRVTTVLPGMQAAFVDIGDEKNAFLHFSDIKSNQIEFKSLFMDEDGIENNGEEFAVSNNITDKLKKGQEIIIQVIKESIGNKGPRITTNIMIPGRYLVLMPTIPHIGVSKKIEDKEERQRLRSFVDEHSQIKGYGYIVRTAAKGVENRELKKEIDYLVLKWKNIEKSSDKNIAPFLLHKEETLTSGLIRDLFTSNVDNVIIDSKNDYESIISYLNLVSPELRSRVKLYEGDIPIFDCFEIEEELEKALAKKVWLKRGGYITIDQTEALIAIDVNTGRYTGKKDPEETILRTNLEAAREIPRQLRLRDIGGIIVIDFIDMESEENKQKVLNELRIHLARDRSKTKTLKVSDMGLVEMTRKRVGPSLFQRYSEICPCCNGMGRVLSMETRSMKIERDLRRCAIYLYEKRLELRVNAKMADYLIQERKNQFNKLQRDLAIDLKIVKMQGFESGAYELLSLDTGKKLNISTKIQDSDDIGIE